jgi:hypothetical protein
MDLVFLSHTNNGCISVEAAFGEEMILTASVSLEAVHLAKSRIDVGGHYSRPDVLQLYVNRRPIERTIESDFTKRSAVTDDTDVVISDSAGCELDAH